MIDISDRQPWSMLKCVLPQHTDHAGVMWHGAYLGWLEEIRVEALSVVGLPYKELSSNGFETPVVSLEINYKIALLHGEEVLLESWSLPRQRARWPWLTKFSRDGIVVAESRVDLVLIKKVGTKHRIVREVPNQMASPLKKLQFGQSLGTKFA